VVLPTHSELGKAQALNLGSFSALRRQPWPGRGGRVILLRLAIGPECLPEAWGKILLQLSAKLCTFLRYVTDKPFIYRVLQWQPSCISIPAICSPHPTRTHRTYGYGTSSGLFASQDST
jgi:hypothetical protein